MLLIARDVAVGVAILGAIATGLVLFLIARQDGSPQGVILGSVLMLTGAAIGAYLAFVQHWL
jgi:CHASE2 domain-containing sensor protein